MPDPTVLEIALSEIAQGASIYATAKKYNICRTKLQYRSKEAGLQTSFQKNMTKEKSSKQEVLNLRKEGLSLSAIASRTGHGTKAIAKWCNEAGIVLSAEQVKENLRKTAKDGDKELAIKYRLKGMFIPEIAKKLKCSKSSVSLWLKQSSVDFSEVGHLIKKKDLDRRHKSRVSDYREKYKILEVLSEGEIFEDMLRERLKGLAFSEIGEKMGVSKDFARTLLKSFPLSSEEKKVINKLVEKRTLMRRHNGELQPVGGLRKGCERSKFGYYKGIYCSSTYELCWVIYQLDHGHKVQRFPGYLEDQEKTFKYYPDFLAGPMHIVEIKGYENKTVAKKTKLAQSLGYKVSLLKRDDLKEVFAYVDKAYNVNANKRFTLYDNYKPKYTLVCTGCGETFSRDNIGVNENKFCTYRCFGTWNIKNNPHKMKPPPPTHKLTDEQALGVFNSKNTWDNIQKEFGISRRLVSLIKSKKSYSWIHSDS